MLRGLPKAYEVARQMAADLLADDDINLQKIIIKLKLAEAQLAPHRTKDDSVHALSSRDSVVCHHCCLPGHVVCECQAKAAGVPSRGQRDSRDRGQTSGYSSSRGGGYGGDSHDRGRQISGYSAPRVGDPHGGYSHNSYSASRGGDSNGYSAPRGSGGGYRGSYASAPNRNYGGGAHVLLR
jgi:hypothetical protein